mmetsp:Transcript_2051/g.2747  ORF Transcript_2051/g.2747 Transcript_2051/m.2747 type:complete len:264 (+) Transcript_2051:81-872(+)
MSSVSYSPKTSNDEASPCSIVDGFENDLRPVTLEFSYEVLTDGYLNRSTVTKVEETLLQELMSTLLECSLFSLRSLATNRYLMAVTNEEDLSYLRGLEALPEDEIINESSCSHSEFSEKCSVVSGKMNFYVELYTTRNEEDKLANILRNNIQAEMDGDSLLQADPSLVKITMQSNVGANIDLNDDSSMNNNESKPDYFIWICAGIGMLLVVVLFLFVYVRKTRKRKPTNKSLHTIGTESCESVKDLNNNILFNDDDGVIEVIA